MTAVVRAWHECGFHGEYTSQARAEYALARHSCTKAHAQRERARRIATRRRTLAATRVRRDCEHQVAHHVHGTHTAYVLDRCRCQPCTDASTAYNRDLERRHAYGQTAYVDAGPVREHIAALATVGVGLKTLAVRSGVSHGCLWKIVYGVPSLGRPPCRRVRRTTEAKILAVPANGVLVAADGARVRATGTARRLRALVALGWSVSKLAQLSGVNRQALDPLLDDAGGFWRLVEARHARAVARLYGRLWRTPAPQAEWRDKIAAARSRARAAAAGWPPPAAWDDEDIDDPNAWPDPSWKDAA